MALSGDLAVSVADDVTFAFSVTNAGTDSLELRFPTGQAVDVSVFADGEPVWRWSDGRLFTQARWSETLHPGESTTYEAVWSEPPPGRYEAVATLEATDVDVEARADLAV